MKISKIMKSLVFYGKLSNIFLLMIKVYFRMLRNNNHLNNLKAAHK